MHCCGTPKWTIIYITDLHRKYVNMLNTTRFFTGKVKYWTGFFARYRRVSTPTKFANRITNHLTKTKNGESYDHKKNRKPRQKHFKWAVDWNWSRAASSTITANPMQANDWSTGLIRTTPYTYSKMGWAICLGHQSARTEPSRRNVSGISLS